MHVGVRDGGGLMTLVPFLQIEYNTSKKLYNINTTKYPFETPTLKNISAKMAIIDKFTIVELTYQGHHYHGLASKADCDKTKIYTGLAVAYNRAFRAMCVNLTKDRSMSNFTATKKTNRRTYRNEWFYHHIRLNPGDEIEFDIDEEVVD